MDPTRRRFLQGSAGAASLALLPASVRRALAMPPPRNGSLASIRHVVILMQENRAFDHYFGSLRGVRGFSDRFPIPLPNGEPVWRQRDAEGRIVLPWHLDTGTTRAQRVEGTPHSWPDAQAAWNDGRMDGWVAAKTARSLGFYREADIGFQFALADAFTVCDAYHASIRAGTNPNRLFHWTGTNDPHGRHGGPAIVNDHDNLGPASEGWQWPTYPERLQATGVDWRIYQDMADNFTDNPLEGFRQYRAVAGGDHPLAQRALSTQPLATFARDIARGRLPQVSWLIAPAKYSEHPGPSCPLWGAAYTARVLDALASHLQVWQHTLLLINFDENDGFFDHMPPPAPPARADDGQLHGGSTVSLDGEYHLARSGPARDRPEWDDPRWHGRAYGLGPRVPMYVVSPWSRGGWVNSEVFDHTSVLRLLELRFGVAEPNISAWRRSVCGDLTSTLDFHHAVHAAWPRPRLPPADAEVARQARLPLPQPPAMPAMPAAATGVRPSHALPYALEVEEAEMPNGLQLDFINRGQAGAVFHVYDRVDTAPPPRRYTVGAGDRSAGLWPKPATHADAAMPHLCVHAPNGFYREYRAIAPLSCACASLRDGGLRLQLIHHGALPLDVHLRNHHAPHLDQRFVLMPGQHWRQDVDLSASAHWYDLILGIAQHPDFLRRWAGRVETGAHGFSDPG